MKIFSILMLASFLVHAGEPLPDKVGFNEYIRPIFSSTCFNCHGPDEHEAKAHLQLHTFEAATQPRTYTTKSGVKKTKEAAILAGNAEDSPVWHRIDTDDEDEMMPPPDFHHSLSDRDKALIKKWIEQGAEYQDHWAYEPIANFSQDKIPETIDEMVSQKLKAKKMPAQNTLDSKEVLIRRLSLDLRGLLPTKEEIKAFLNDKSPNAWEILVEKFLSSKSYGERMAVHWFDLVRYSNSVGFHGDQENLTAPYRDYVIQAFNDNMPYDQFTLEQLAGDLLEKPTQSQIIATAYNRLIKVTKEGGAQAGEYLAKYAADRVSNLSAVWLGSTLECAECHNHKYDPFTTKDFYSMAAFFADIKQVGVYNRFNGRGLGNNSNFPPTLVILPPEEKREFERLEKEYEESKQQDAAEMKQWQAELKKLPKEAVDQIKSLKEKINKRKKQKYSQKTKDVHKAYQALSNKATYCVITETQKPRVTRILPRGNWMDESGEVVEPQVPHFLRGIDKEGRATRLDLAKWLCSEDNPMASRSFVNRVWALYFGHGLSGVTGDLGSQGELPVNLELLDFLSRKFIDSGWNIKQMVKGIVMSKTYRLSTKRNQEMMAKDPYNRYLSRQSILRLNAEFIRDTSLQVSGLLNSKMGGRNVMPYQPDGYYASMNFNPFKYRSEKDEEQYRRAVYMHWQRTFLHPFLKNFDAPEREVALCSRTASNTPLQALTLLNDPTFVEAAKAFSELAHLEVKSNVDQKIEWMHERALGRPCTSEEHQVLKKLYTSQLQYFKTHPESCKSFLSVGNKKVNDALNPNEVAALTQVARTLMNSHEFIVRR